VPARTVGGQRNPRRPLWRVSQAQIHERHEPGQSLGFEIGVRFVREWGQNGVFL
jgi:hypothetical protein